MQKASGFIIVLFVCLLILTAGCTRPAPPSSLGPATLPPAEVRSYEGRDLSSVQDFRENSILGPQQVNITDFRLTVGGLVATPRRYTYDEVLGSPRQYRKVVTLHCVEGWDATILWEGVRVADLIEDAGPDPRATTVIFTARDGYTTSLPLSYLRDNNILLAYRMNNVTLPAERGYPLQLVAEEKWGYKWIKWVERIELSDNVAYRGYWESRGYSDTADLSKNSRGP